MFCGFVSIMLAADSAKVAESLITLSIGVNLDDSE